MHLRGIITIIVSVFLTSCLRIENYPNEPVIQFESFTPNDSGALLNISFTDGDGNFGLGQLDTTGIFGDCQWKYNVFCEYYEKQNGVWNHIELDPCLDVNIIPFYYRAPIAEPLGQAKAQKGNIQLQMYPLYYLPTPFDTCKFEIRIADRNQNTSNRVFTTQFIKPI
jgi:hypothetical protein